MSELRIKVIIENSESKVDTKSGQNSEISNLKSQKSSNNSRHYENTSLKSQEIIKREKLVVCNNYASMPVVLSKGVGVFLYDVDGNKYYDFLSGFSSVNQGHCHPKIIGALVKQVSVLHHTSRAFHSDLLVEYAEFLTKLFGYVSILK